jgi:hypothetical protein
MFLQPPGRFVDFSLPQTTAPNVTDYQSDAPMAILIILAEPDNYPSIDPEWAVRCSTLSIPYAGLSRVL